MHEYPAPDYVAKVHIVKSDVKTVSREIVTALNTYPLSLNATPVMILPHAPRRRHAQFVINGTGIVAIGKAQSDCQAAQVNASGEYTGNVAVINGAELASSYKVIGTSEVWAAMVAVSDPSPTYAAITQPVVPATGVAAQNQNNAPVTVVIGANGATITNVTVNGVTVGTTAGTYIVPAAGTISIAYTVATPTWTWAITAPPAPILPTSIAIIKETECE